MYKSSQTTGSVLLSQTSMFPNWIDKKVKVETPVVKTQVPQTIQVPSMRVGKRGLSSQFFEKISLKSSEFESSFFKKSIKDKIY